MALSPSERKLFHERGIFSFASLVPKTKCDTAKRSILAECDRLMLTKNGKLASTRIESLPFFQQTTSLSQMTKNICPTLDELFSEKLARIMSSLVNTKLKPSSSHPQLLLSFPQTKKWTVPSSNWHVDLAIPAQDEIPGVQVFVLIDDVKPQGGATLAIAGSHRLPYLKGNKGFSAHTILRNHPLFNTLYNETGNEIEPFFQPQKIDGIDVYLMEMAGRAGDVFLMDMRVLHSPSVNATKQTRLMTTQRFLRL